MSKMRKEAWFYLEHHYEHDVAAGRPDTEDRVLNALYTITAEENVPNRVIGREAVYYNSTTLPKLPENSNSEISVLAKDIIQCAFEYSLDTVIDKKNYTDEEGQKKLYDVAAFLSGPVFTYFGENIDNPPVTNSAESIHPLETVTKILYFGYRNSKDDHELNAEFTFRLMQAHSLQPKGHLYSGLQKEVREKYIHYMNSPDTDPLMRLEMVGEYPEIMMNINKKPCIEDALKAAQEVTEYQSLSNNDRTSAKCICADLRRILQHRA